MRVCMACMAFDKVFGVSITHCLESRSGAGTDLIVLLDQWLHNGLVIYPAKSEVPDRAIVALHLSRKWEDLDV